MSAKQSGRGDLSLDRYESVAAKQNRLSSHSSVYADRFNVIARSGRRRLVLVVVCPFCRDRHTHFAPVDFTSGIRTAACGGRYVLLTAKQLQVVA